jgi:hypothetical protein
MSRLAQERHHRQPVYPPVGRAERGVRLALIGIDAAPPSHRGTSRIAFLLGASRPASFAAAKPSSFGFLGIGWFSPAVRKRPRLINGMRAFEPNLLAHMHGTRSVSIYVALNFVNETSDSLV